MKIVVCGSGWFGAETLALVRALGHDVPMVTAPAHDRPDRLAAAAALAGIPLTDPTVFRSSSLPAGTDLIVAAHAHHFISRRARYATRLGAIGYHPSLLPLHRGRDAVRWVIHARERVTGGTVYWLTDTVDGGPIAAQSHVFVRPNDTARSLWERELGPLGLLLLRRTLTDIAAGLLIREEQDERLATWEPAFGSAPLFRPELTAIGDGRGLGFTVQPFREAVPRGN